MGGLQAMNLKRIILMFILLPVFSCATAVDELRYVNREFQFSVAVPAGASTCRSQAPEHDGGLDVFLDSGPDGCEGLQLRPFIGVSASYNAMLAESAEVFLSLIEAGATGKSGTVPQRLEIVGMKSASSRRDRDDGWIDIRVVTQGGRWPNEGAGDKERIPYINYVIMLHTTQDRLDGDVERLRTVLRDVQIFPTQ